MFNLKKELYVALACGGLVACGNNDSGHSSDSTSGYNRYSSTLSSGQNAVEPSSSEDTISIKGMGVKGPLANASVAVYAYDSSQEDFKGRLLAEGSTDANAQLQLEVPARHSIEEMMLIEYSQGTELNGSAPIIPTLKTVITAEQFLNNTPVYATPLSTLVVESALQEAAPGASASSFSSKIAAASADTSRAFGLGLLSENTDFFTLAPVLTSDSVPETTLAYRTANEVFAAVVGEIKSQSEGANSSAMPSNTIIEGVAEDMRDGVLDGKAAGLPVSQLEAVPESQLRSIFTANPDNMQVPGSDVTVAELDEVLTNETQQINPGLGSVDVRDISPQPIVVEFAAVVTPEPTPVTSPVTEPEPVATPVPAPIPTPTPTPVIAEPSPIVAPAPSPIVAEPSPEPLPTPTPTPTPVIAAPAPTPTPTPEPVVAQPEPEPEPEFKGFNASITWSAPTTREDGSPLLANEIDHYEIYYYNMANQAGDGSIATFDTHRGTSSNPAVIELTEQGAYALAVACIDTDGNISDISDEVIINVP